MLLSPQGLGSLTDPEWREIQKRHVEWLETWTRLLRGTSWSGLDLLFPRIGLHLCSRAGKTKNPWWYLSTKQLSCLSNLIGMLGKGTSLHFGNVVNAGKEMVILGQHGCNIIVGNGLGFDSGIFQTLCWAPDKGDELIIVQGPHSLRSGRLHTILLLKFTAECHVPEDAKVE